MGAAFNAGASSADYAARFGALHLVTEVPYWSDGRVATRPKAAAPTRRSPPPGRRRGAS
ncbi:hypothetical protein AB0O76_38305 [Streptomyces sp. NPDC086554]|uniref:hypothetical protein n=1 Tax=Streptomyces sp. NPDC086554 TaxID=3154864 RepID=UPI00343E982F